jgi:sulfatase modifying factor 1
MLLDPGRVSGSKLTWMIVSVAVCAAAMGYRQHRLQLAKALQPAGAYSDNGIGTARAQMAADTAPMIQAAWTPKINDSKPSEPAPAGMIWIPGGQFWMGTSDEHMLDTKPWHRVYVDGYWMDKAEVTNEEFARFVSASGYVTVAERTPRAENYPGAIPENLVAGAVVFTPPNHPIELNDHFQWWSYVHGSNWMHPEGPASDIKNRMNHPVVQIAYEDAVAYCRWDGKRLPTEAEFEFASRGGLDRKRYDWGGR